MPDRRRPPLVERVREGADFAAREITRPGLHVPRRTPQPMAVAVAGELDDTHDESREFDTRDRTPVREIVERVETLETTIDMPSWEEFREMRREVAACKADRERREAFAAKWGRLLLWAKTFAGGLVVAVLTWGVTKIDAGGAARSDAAHDRSLLYQLRDQLEAVRLQQAADHAVLYAPRNP